jgi:hypothetical protein
VAGGQTCTIRYCQQQGAGGTVLQKVAGTAAAATGATTSAEAITPGQYYCRATARNGASGWAANSDQSSAAVRAVNNCYHYSRGSPCTLQYCNMGGPRSASARTASPAKTAATIPSAPTSPTQTGMAGAPKPAVSREKAPDCAVCDRHLFGDFCKAIRITGNAIVNVAQARTDFLTCRQRAGGRCGETNGKIFVDKAATGCLKSAQMQTDAELFFKSCMTRALNNHCK